MSDTTITSVEAPLTEPFGYAQAWVETRTATLVRVETSNGTIGWGECWGPVAGTRETVESVLAPHVIGENSLHVERLHDRLYAAGRTTYQTVVPLPAISGIDIAGKHNEPVSTLLCGGIPRARSGLRDRPLLPTG